MTIREIGYLLADVASKAGCLYDQSNADADEQNEILCATGEIWFVE